MSAAVPEISVIVCTHNPELPRLRRVLEAIANQGDAPEYEFILVDNGSDVRVEPSLSAIAGGMHSRALREERLGLSFARQAGINASVSATLCFVDDDNILAPDYLSNALKISQSETMLGVFGGRSIGQFEATPGWLCRHFLARYALRNEPLPVTLSRPERSQRGFEPFGAGMIVRRDVAIAFVSLMTSLEGDLPLGRNGTQLGSGEDSMFVRLAFQLGLNVGYRPELTLFHAIDQYRFRWSYLRRLLEGQARGEAVLDALDGFQLDIPADIARSIGATQAVRFARRLISVGPAEAIGLHFWDRAYAGYLDQAKAISERISNVLTPDMPEKPQLAPGRS